MKLSCLYVTVAKENQWKLFDLIHERRGWASQMPLEKSDTLTFSVHVDENELEEAKAFLEGTGYPIDVKTGEIELDIDRDAIHKNLPGLYALHTALMANRSHNWRLNILKHLKDVPFDEVHAYPSTDFGSMVTTTLKLFFPDWLGKMTNFSTAQIHRTVGQVIYPFSIQEGA